MGRLDGRVAVVTGGAQGLGAAYVKALAREGAKAVVADVLDGRAVVAAVEAAGGQGLALETDVSDETSVNDMADRVLRRFGRIDILVANAAIFGSFKLQPFTELGVEEWDRVMAVNVRGPFLCAKAVVPAMRRQGWGRIINIASGMVFKGTANFLHYVTSKGAVLALTRSLARELGEDGICVNTLAPGLVLSERVQANREMLDELAAPVLGSRAIKRHQEPDDLIGPLLFLASEDCRFMTGQVVVVDGGSVTY